MKLRINEKEFPLLSARAATENMKNYRRDVISLTIEATYAEAAAEFTDGATFTVVDDSVTPAEEFEYADHTMAGAITDNRDGTVTVKMGKGNTAEQDAQEEAKAANEMIVAIAGAPVTDVEMVRSVVEAGAATLTDGEAAKMPSLSQKWVVGEAVNVGDRRFYEPTQRLYKCRQAHTTQADWPPDQTPAMWAVIDVDHAGTIDDPIPAARGMDYIYGKYYLDPEDSKTYICKRIGEEEGGVINLQYLPHELVGQYFSAAETGTEEPETPEEAASQEAAEEGASV